MPSRLIRDGILDSERYWSVTIEARQLFLHMLLLADDFGCISLAPVFIRRRCFNESPSLEKIAKLLGELVDVDLLRAYEVGAAKYAFIPRFRQRIQRMTLKHPAPPDSIVQDEPDLLQRLRQIKDASKNPTDGHQLPTVGQPPEVKRREEKRIKPKSVGWGLPDWVPVVGWKDFEEMRTRIRKPLTDRARQLAVAELRRLRDEGHEPLAVIEQSVLQCWKSFYPLKNTVKPAMVI